MLICTLNYACVLSRDLAVLQSIADLAGEIVALKQEVIRKELHMLSLYRRVFDQHLSDSYSSKISCKLSEDIRSYIASVYCKLASTPSQDADSVTSPFCCIFKYLLSEVS